MHNRHHTETPVSSLQRHREAMNPRPVSNDKPWQWVAGSLFTVLALFALAGYWDEQSRLEDELAKARLQVEKARYEARLQGRRDVHDAAASMGCQIVLGRPMPDAGSAAAAPAQ
jgi:hypothetical protein